MKCLPCVLLCALVGAPPSDARAQYVEEDAPAVCPSPDFCDVDDNSDCGNWLRDYDAGIPSGGYYVGTEALLLQRSATGFGGGHQPLVINTGTGATLFSIADTDSARFQAGPRVLLGRKLRDGSAWEASYFGIENWGSNSTVTGNGDLAIPGDLGLASIDFFNVDQMHVTLASQLHNFELNYLRPLGNISLLGGFRYVNLTEQFAITPSVGGTAGGVYRIGTGNNLFGAQVGARTGRQAGRWSWSLTGKAGLFGNAAVERQFVEDFPAFVLRDAQASSGRVAFVGDLNFSAGFQLNRVWSIRAGYNLLWIDGVALAAQQADFTDTASSGTNLLTGGGLFLHGVNVGLVGRW